MPKRSRRLLVPLVTATVLALAALVLPPGQATAATTGTLAGTVTGSGGQLAGGTVEVYAIDSGSSTSLPTASYDFTSSAFSITLAAGHYEVRFLGRGGGVNWAPEWWANSTVRSGSLQVTVTAGGTTTLSADLAPGGSISGTTVAGATVDAYQSDAGFASGFARAARTQATSNGTFSLLGLAPGSYRVHVFSASAGKEGWWANATSLDSATAITLGAGGAVTGINPTLAKAGTVSGLVFDTQGKPVSGAKLNLYEFNGVSWILAGVTSATTSDGTFQFPAPAGSYRLEFVPSPKGGLRKEFWFDAATVNAGLNFSVSIGANTPNISTQLDYNTFSLSKGATLTGTLKVGQTLHATAPKASPAPTSTTYRWLRNGKLVSGAKLSTYKLTSSDRGKQISVRITLVRYGVQTLVRTVTRKTLVP